MAVISDILDYLESLSSLSVADSENLVKLMFTSFLPRLEKHLARGENIVQNKMLTQASEILCALLTTVRHHDVLQFVMLV